MHYRSIPDLAETLQNNLHRLPREVDLVVGLPGGGILAANLLCLILNLPMSDLDSFLAGRSFSVGRTKLDPGGVPPRPRRIVVIGDTAPDGASLQAARDRLTAMAPEVEAIFVLAYGPQEALPGADLVFETVPDPCIFQWSFMQHEILERACVDIDGVLCLDPTQEQNDDGAAYLEFLATARPLYRPARRIGMLVTSRLEKYRRETEDWLAARGIRHDRLVMLDLPSQAERIRLGAHGSFKAEVYRQSDAPLFIESENRQARRIAALSGKPVLCLETHRLITPAMLAAEAPVPAGTPATMRLLKRMIRDLIGPRGVDALKRRLVR
ncbi:phosphoribosyltransferase [Cereibacter sphaeroides]|uniref:phosphoribosyltransferase n=1 Tax=Cereibacter sphaeroides TaxID=1063 RepID=UPI001F1ED3F8|nr:phosphoribosyltransferase [Cereibacter sphaeroides]MCE6960703.1 phosphoribosyltransferase [Cereibacter sphaeroides]MCE6970031.1 phosphoribosyltransferase [Cereibacter sphaeroides]MCE6973195.1 phosphoribosyltransferase [Cereibacter sphaeroides]